MPGDLYLFVVTNTPDSSDASKTTYDMMKGLGQEQLMPQVQRDLAHDLREKREQLKQVRKTYIPIPMSGAARKTTSNGWSARSRRSKRKA